MAGNFRLQRFFFRDRSEEFSSASPVSLMRLLFLLFRHADGSVRFWDVSSGEGRWGGEREGRGEGKVGVGEG